VSGIVRTYFPPLPRSVATLQVGGLVNAFGNGIVLPFLFIYLHNVRGIALGPTGLIVAQNFCSTFPATTGTGPPPTLGPPRLPEVPAVAVDPV